MSNTKRLKIIINQDAQQKLNRGEVPPNTVLGTVFEGDTKYVIFADTDKETGRPRLSKKGHLMFNAVPARD